MHNLDAPALRQKKSIRLYWPGLPLLLAGCVLAGVSCAAADAELGPVEPAAISATPAVAEAPDEPQLTAEEAEQQQYEKELWKLVRQGREVPLEAQTEAAVVSFFSDAYALPVMVDSKNADQLRNPRFGGKEPLSLDRVLRNKSGHEYFTLNGLCFEDSQVLLVKAPLDGYVPPPDSVMARFFAWRQAAVRQKIASIRIVILGKQLPLHSAFLMAAIQLRAATRVTWRFETADATDQAKTLVDVSVKEQTVGRTMDQLTAQYGLTWRIFNGRVLIDVPPPAVLPATDMQGNPVPTQKKEPPPPAAPEPDPAKLPPLPPRPDPAALAAAMADLWRIDVPVPRRAAGQTSVAAMELTDFCEDWFQVPIVWEVDALEFAREGISLRGGKARLTDLSTIHGGGLWLRVEDDRIVVFSRRVRGTQAADVDLKLAADSALGKVLAAREAATQASLKQSTVEIHGRDLTVAAALTSIGAQVTAIKLRYDSAATEARAQAATAGLHLREMPLADALNNVLKRAGLTYRTRFGVVIVCLNEATTATNVGGP